MSSVKEVLQSVQVYCSNGILLKVLKMLFVSTKSFILIWVYDFCIPVFYLSLFLVSSNQTVLGRTIFSSFFFLIFYQSLPLQTKVSVSVTYDDFTGPPEPRIRFSAHFMQNFKQPTDGKKFQVSYYFTRYELETWIWKSPYLSTLFHIVF